MEVLLAPRRNSVAARMVMAFLGRMPIRQRRSMLFLRHNGRLPRLRDPQTFQEKVNWRVFYDRRPEIAWTCDKLAARRRAAEASTAVRVPEVYWSGTDLGELLSVELPDHWILKLNNASGLVLKGDGLVDARKLSELIRLTDGWLDQDLAGIMGEWAYGQSERCFLAEQMVGDGSTGDYKNLINYKAHVFDGEVKTWKVEKMEEGAFCFS